MRGAKEAKRTLRPYEHVEVPWEQIEARRREVISLLNRANRRAKVTREILESLKKSGQVLFDLLVPPRHGKSSAPRRRAI